MAASVVSASRRTDLPSFYSDWFYGRLAEGFVDVANPYNSAQVRRVSLKPEDVACFVFWTRDARPMLERLGELDGYAYYFQWTITGYGPPLEPGGPEVEVAIAALRAMAAKVGPSRLVWRYDPVLVAGRYDAAWHAENFRRLAGGIGGSVRHCVISLYDAYRHSNARLRKAGFSGLPEISTGKERSVPGNREIELVRTLVDIAGEKGIAVSFCAEPGLTATPAEKVGCIDARIVGELTDKPFSIRKDKNQRPGCACIESVDIGRYGTCPRGCLYCYADRR